MAIYNFFGRRIIIMKIVDNCSRSARAFFMTSKKDKNLSI